MLHIEPGETKERPMSDDEFAHLLDGHVILFEYTMDSVQYQKVFRMPFWTRWHLRYRRWRGLPITYSPKIEIGKD